tara:strand:- start:1269 stop:1628 length:360 start_codon:yes stop_codon:yes gene_type:complete
MKQEKLSNTSSEPGNTTDTANPIPDKFDIGELNYCCLESSGDWRLYKVSDYGQSSNDNVINCFEVVRILMVKEVLYNPNGEKIYSWTEMYPFVGEWEVDIYRRATEKEARAVFREKAQG